MNAFDRKIGSDRRVIVSRLRRLVGHLEGGLPLDDEDRDFLVSGIEIYLSSNSGVSLDQALGLRSRGGVSVQRTLQNDERDDLIRHLVREHPVWAFDPPTTAARKVRHAFDAYESNRWLRDRNAALAPITEPQATFWRLLKDDMRMPQQKRLSQILDVEIQYPI